MGDIRINRKLFNGDLWQHKPFGRGQAWVDLIGLANWKDNMVIIRDDNFHLKRGQLVGSYRFLGKRWGWGAKRVSNLCQTLKRQQRITLSTQHQTTIITICKYDSYQTPLNYKATVKATTEETVRQQSGNSEATKQRTKEEQKKNGRRKVLTIETKSANAEKTSLFPKPTQQQKKDLALLHNRLIAFKFNVFTFMSRVRKQKGYFPPIDAILKIGRGAVKAKPVHVWAYFMKALAQELPKHFADLNIGEARKLKKEPLIIGDIMRMAAKQKELQ